MYVDYFYFYDATQLLFRKLGSERRSNGADDGIVMEGDGLFRIKKILQLRGVIGQRELVAVFRSGNIQEEQAVLAICNAYTIRSVKCCEQVVR